MNKTNMGKYFGRKDTLMKQFRKGQIYGNWDTHYIYVDNNSPVLLVAHMDTVQTPELRAGNTGAGFDDRLGCFVGHQLVKNYPQWFDLLITDYEESGSSTAEFFCPSHEYNFVVELDREGAGYVDYDLASEELQQYLWVYGLECNWGSYSDIVEMDFIKCSKINLGLGTYNGHAESPHSGFIESTLDSQIKKLLNFVEDYHDKHFEYCEGWRRWISGGRYDYGYNLSDIYDMDDEEIEREFQKDEMTEEERIEYEDMLLEKFLHEWKQDHPEEPYTIDGSFWEEWNEYCEQYSDDALYN